MTKFEVINTCEQLESETSCLSNQKQAPYNVKHCLYAWAFR